MSWWALKLSIWCSPSGDTCWIKGLQWLLIFSPFNKGFMKTCFSFLAVHEEFVLATICIFGVPKMFAKILWEYVCVTCYNMKNLKSKYQYITFLNTSHWKIVWRLCVMYTEVSTGVPYKLQWKSLFYRGSCTTTLKSLVLRPSQFDEANQDIYFSTKF